MLKGFERVQVNVGLDKFLVDLLDNFFPLSSRSSAVRYILVEYFSTLGLYDKDGDV